MYSDTEHNYFKIDIIHDPFGHATRRKRVRANTFLLVPYLADFRCCVVLPCSATLTVRGTAFNTRRRSQKPPKRFFGGFFLPVGRPPNGPGST